MRRRRKVDLWVRGRRGGGNEQGSVRRVLSERAGDCGAASARICVAGDPERCVAAASSSCSSAAATASSLSSKRGEGQDRRASWLHSPVWARRSCCSCCSRPSTHPPRRRRQACAIARRIAVLASVSPCAVGADETLLLLVFVTGQYVLLVAVADGARAAVARAWVRAVARDDRVSVH